MFTCSLGRDIGIAGDESRAAVHRRGEVLRKVVSPETGSERAGMRMGRVGGGVTADLCQAGQAYLTPMKTEIRLVSCFSGLCRRGEWGGGPRVSRCSVTAVIEASEPHQPALALPT